MSLAYPWMLAGLLVLPLLWWWLRHVPPAPRREIFPPLRLLVDLVPSHTFAARMPWWLLLLRLGLVALAIVAAAGPLWDAQPQAAKTTGPLVLAFDDGWAAAADWDQRRGWLEDQARRAQEQGREVYVVPTAPPLPESWNALTGADAAAKLHGWVPKAWGTDRAAVMAALPALKGAEILWLSDGLDNDHGQAFAASLARLGNGPKIIRGHTGAALSAETDGDAWVLRVNRLDTAPIAVVARDGAGAELARGNLEGNNGNMRLPLDLRNRVSRLVIEGQEQAAAVFLLDERAKRRRVVLVEEQGQAPSAPLLDGLTYVDKALQPVAQVSRDGLAAKPDVMVMTGLVADDQAMAVQDWVDQGGVLIRFASGGLADRFAEPLLPVTLRPGGRQLGGALSWAQPQEMAAFAADSPFAGLVVPPDIRVGSQLLADPSQAALVWARLKDGTPLVSAMRWGKGWVVLFHVAPVPGWSTLPLSGLFPDMLHRLVMLAAGHGMNTGPLPPQAVMDGRGQMQAPGPQVTAWDDGATMGPNHPPGWYGGRAINLGPDVPPLRTLDLPSSGMNDRPVHVDLRPGLVLLALLLGLVEWGLCLRLAVLVVMLLPGMGMAAEPGNARLGVVISGDGALDRHNLTGLQALTEVVRARTMAELDEPQMVAADNGQLALYPLLYWPVRADLPLPPAGAAIMIKRYLRQGGMILFDRLDNDPAALRRLNAMLDLPPVQPLPEDHVLGRSFYLLPNMPGPLWGDADAADHDRVSGVLLATGDWAGRWAGPGSDTEMSLRFGVNLCLYALTGNYKADQVHAKALLERLGRQP